MGFQPLLAGEQGDFVGHLRQCVAGKVGKLRFFNEIIDRQRRREARGAAGGQCVVRPGHVVAERFGAVLAEEDGPGVADAVEVIKRLIDA